MIENLSQEQLAGILEAIPIEISFVDENDLVKFWNRHETRIFKRPASVVGKSVQNCHPKHSLDKVNQILSDFKAGRYLGTLEVTQDITEIKQIEGEKRLLDYQRGR
jgi:DUF438 domain-containing protein